MAGILGGDYQFDPGTYGYGSGLLGLLGMGQQLPAQAPGGFAAADNSVLPQQSAPTGGMLPPQMAPQMAPQAAPQQPVAQAPGLGLGDRAMAALANFSNARGLLPALTGAVTGGLTGQRTDPVGLMLQQQGAIYQALRSANVPDPVARAAALDPEIRKTIAPQLYSKPTLVKTGTDPFTGQDSYVWQQPDQMRVTPAISNGMPVGPGGGSGAPAGTQQIFDNIERARNAGATQQQMLQLLPNSVRDATGALLAGRAIPNQFSMRGNARDMMLRAATAIDPNFDATMIPMRTAFAHGMAQTTPNSPGGQKLLLNTALQHAAEIADRFTQLHNSNGILTSVPGSSYVGNAYNNIKNSSSAQGETVNAINDISQKLSGEVGKLYSGASGGGEAERQATAGRFSTGNTPNETIGALEATKSLILDKLNSLQNQRDQVYGQQGENIYPLVDKQTKAALDKIDKAISTLRGGGASAPQAAQSSSSVAPLPPPDKEGWINLPNGIRIREKK